MQMSSGAPLDKARHAERPSVSASSSSRRARFAEAPGAIVVDLESATGQLANKDGSGRQKGSRRVVGGGSGKSRRKRRWSCANMMSVQSLLAAMILGLAVSIAVPIMVSNSVLSFGLGKSRAEEVMTVQVGRQVLEIELTVLQIPSIGLGDLGDMVASGLLPVNKSGIDQADVALTLSTLIRRTSHKSQCGILCIYNGRDLNDGYGVFNVSYGGIKTILAIRGNGTASWETSRLTWLTTYVYVGDPQNTSTPTMPLRVVAKKYSPSGLLEDVVSRNVTGAYASAGSLMGIYGVLQWRWMCYPGPATCRDLTTQWESRAYLIAASVGCAEISNTLSAAVAAAGIGGARAFLISVDKGLILALSHGMPWYTSNTTSMVVSKYITNASNTVGDTATDAMLAALRGGAANCPKPPDGTANTSAAAIICAGTMMDIGGHVVTSRVMTFPGLSDVWVVYFAVPSSYVYASIWTMIWTGVSVAVGVTVGASTVILTIQWALVSRPLSRMSDLMRDVSKLSNARIQRASDFGSRSAAADFRMKLRESASSGGGGGGGKSSGHCCRGAFTSQHTSRAHSSDEPADAVSGVAAAIGESSSGGETDDGSGADDYDSGGEISDRRRRRCRDGGIRFDTKRASASVVAAAAAAASSTEMSSRKGGQHIAAAVGCVPSASAKSAKQPPGSEKQKEQRLKKAAESGESWRSPSGHSFASESSANSSASSSAGSQSTGCNVKPEFSGAKGGDDDMWDDDDNNGASDDAGGGGGGGGGHSSSGSDDKVPENFADNVDAMRRPHVVREVGAIFFALRVFFNVIYSFKRYVPSDISMRLLYDMTPKIKPCVKSVSVIFCDMKGSTVLASRVGPDQSSALFSYVREAHSAISRAIFGVGGSINDYIGDEVVGMLNLATTSKNEDKYHEGKCCIAAVRARAALAAMVHKWDSITGGKYPEFPRPVYRIGLASGSAPVGDIGWHKAFSKFTAMGRVPSLGARLQGASKVIDTPSEILLPEITWSAAVAQGVAVDVSEVDPDRDIAAAVVAAPAVPSLPGDWGCSGQDPRDPDRAALARAAFSASSPSSVRVVCGHCVGEALVGGFDAPQRLYTLLDVSQLVAAAGSPSSLPAGEDCRVTEFRALVRAARAYSAAITALSLGEFAVAEESFRCSAAAGYMPRSSNFLIGAIASGLRQSSTDGTVDAKMFAFDTINVPPTTATTTTIPEVGCGGVVAGDTLDPYDSGVE